MKTIITTLLIVVTCNLTAQKNQGYFGKKFLVSVETLSQVPVTNNLVRKKADYLKYDKDLSEAQDWFNYGFRISAGVIVKKNIIISFESGLDFSNIYMNKTLAIPGYQSHITKIPSIGIQTLNFMPKIEFASKRALLPMGFSSQVGIGLSFTKPVEKLYKAKAQVLIDVDENVTMDVNPEYMNKHFYDYENAAPVKTLTLMYGLSMRSPLSKHFMLNYGVRYTLNFRLQGKSKSSGDYILSDEVFGNLVADQRILSLMHFNLGITCVF